MIETMIYAFLIIPAAATIAAGFGMSFKAMLHPQTWHKVSMKPIDCALCLSFWFNIAYQPGENWLYTVIIALASGVVAKKIDERL